METLKDKWVVDKTYKPPINSDIKYKEINTRNGDVRYYREYFTLINKKNKTSPFIENLKDYVYLSSNPLMWVSAFIGYSLHYLSSPILIFASMKYGDYMNSYLCDFIIFLLTISLVISFISKKYNEAIIAIISIIIYITILLLCASIALYPLITIITN